MPATETRNLFPFSCFAGFNLKVLPPFAPWMQLPGPATGSAALVAVLCSQLGVFWLLLSPAVPPPLPPAEPPVVVCEVEPIAGFSWLWYGFGALSFLAGVGAARVVSAGQRVLTLGLSAAGGAVGGALAGAVAERSRSADTEESKLSDISGIVQLYGADESSPARPCPAAVPEW